MTDLTKLKSLGAWQEARRKIDASLREVLGPITRSRTEIQLKTVDELDYSGYTRRRVNYFVDEWTRVAAWLFLPEGRDELPAILCCHSRVKQGKDEPAGIAGDPALAFAQRYAEMGYATLCPDCITAGERVSSRAAAYDTAAFYKDHPKTSLAGKMVADHMAALDIFSEIRRIDSARIGVIGHGLGGFNALLLSALDERVQACVANNAFTRLETDAHPERWTTVGETTLPLMPALAPSGPKKTWPFDFEELLALAAPTATLVSTATRDCAMDQPRSCAEAVSRAERVYKLLGASGAIEVHEHDDGDGVGSATMEVFDEWFDRWL